MREYSLRLGESRGETHATPCHALYSEAGDMTPLISPSSLGPPLILALLDDDCSGRSGSLYLDEVAIKSTAAAAPSLLPPSKLRVWQ